MEFLIFLFAIFYFILAYKRLDWAMMILITGLPSYLIRFDIFSIPMTVLELMILISFTVWVFWHTKFLNILRGKYRWKEIKVNRKKRLPYPWRWEIILVLLISYGAVALAGFNSSALGIWKAYFFEPILVFILVLNVLGRKEKELSRETSRLSSFSGAIEKLLWPLAASALAISLIAIYQRITGQLAVQEFWPRVTGVFPYPNALGLYLGPLAMVLIGWLIENFQSSIPGRGRGQVFNFQLISIKYWSLLFTIIISIVAIFLSRSEGALAAVAVGLVVLGLIAGKRIRWAAVALVIIISLGIGLYQPVRNYAVKKITLRDLSGEIRKQQWRETLEMLTNNPNIFLLGTGLANYKPNILPFHQEGIFYDFDNDPEFHRHVVWDEKYKQAHWQPVEIYLYPHNFFLNFWTELGLAGMLLFTWLVIKYFSIGLRIIRSETATGWLKNKRPENIYLTSGLLLAMVTIIIHGAVDVPYFKNDLAVMFWILIAILSIVNLLGRARTVNNK